MTNAFIHPYLFFNGRCEEALEFYGNGLELSEALAKAVPNDAQVKGDLSVAYERLGNSHLRRGSIDKEIERDIEDAIAFAESSPFPDTSALTTNVFAEP